MTRPDRRCNAVTRASSLESVSESSCSSRRIVWWLVPGMKVIMSVIAEVAVDSADARNSGPSNR